MLWTCLLWCTLFVVEMSENHDFFYDITLKLYFYSWSVYSLAFTVFNPLLWWYRSHLNIVRFCSFQLKWTKQMKRSPGGKASSLKGTEGMAWKRCTCFWLRLLSICTSFYVGDKIWPMNIHKPQSCEPIGNKMVKLRNLWVASRY